MNIKNIHQSLHLQLMIEKDRKFPNFMKLIKDKQAELEEKKVEKTIS